MGFSDMPLDLHGGGAEAGRGGDQRVLDVQWPILARGASIPHRPEIIQLVS